MYTWNPWEEPPQRDEVRVGGRLLRPGDRVRLRPRPGGDILDLALAGKTTTIASIEEDYEGRIYLAVTVDDDPGKDLGEQRKPGHRFFFAPEDAEPLEQTEARQA